MTARDFYSPAYRQAVAVGQARIYDSPVGTAPLSRTVEVSISEADYSVVVLLAKAGDTTTGDILRGMLRQECRVAQRALEDTADLYKHDPVAEALTGGGS